MNQYRFLALAAFAFWSLSCVTATGPVCLDYEVHTVDMEGISSKTVSIDLTGKTGAHPHFSCGSADYPLSTESVFVHIVGDGFKTKVTTLPGPVNSLRDPLIRVFAKLQTDTSEWCENLRCIGANDDTLGWMPELTFIAYEGRDYYILVSNRRSDYVGPIDVEIERPHYPLYCGDGFCHGANGENQATCCDDCFCASTCVDHTLCQATSTYPCPNFDTIVVGSDVQFETSTGDELSLPTESEFSGYCGLHRGGKGKWFRFLGTGGNLRLTTQASPSLPAVMDTVIRVYVDHGDSPWCWAMPCEGYNDDASGALPFHSTLTVSTELGRAYYAFVGALSDTDNGAIRLQLSDPTSGASCGDATCSTDAGESCKSCPVDCACEGRFETCRIDDTAIFTHSCRFSFDEWRCGPGASNLDSDNDGVRDCLDECPNDDRYIWATPVCGCDVCVDAADCEWRYEPFVWDQGQNTWREGRWWLC